MPDAPPAEIVEFVILGLAHIRLERIEPMALRFLVSFASDNQLRVRDGRIAQRTRLAQLRRAEGGADAAALSRAT